MKSTLDAFVAAALRHGCEFYVRRRGPRTSLELVDCGVRVHKFVSVAAVEALTSARPSRIIPVTSRRPR